MKGILRRTVGKNSQRFPRVFFVAILRQGYTGSYCTTPCAMETYVHVFQTTEVTVAGVLQLPEVQAILGPFELAV